jgi:membrane-associated phospholipid phosphatase
MDEGNSSRGLCSPGTLGKQPIIGLMMFIIGSLIFIIIAYNLINQGPLIQWDLPLAQWFYALGLNSSPLMINIMVAGYYIGLQGVVVIAVLLALYFLYKRFWRELVMVVVSFGGGGLLFLSLSHIFMRPRPFLLFDKIIWAGTPNIPGFPSGHTLNIIICFGFLVYLLVPKIKSYLGNVLVVLIALLVILFVGFSRLYIGDHYLTDVIAGYAVGIAWFGLSLTSIELLFKKYNLRKEKRKLDHGKHGTKRNQ